MLGQTTLPLVFRAFQQSDYERLVEIQNAIFPEYPSSVEEMRYDDESLDRSRYLRERFVGIDQDSGRILGWGVLGHVPHNYHPQKFQVNVYVDPAFQGRRVGAQMYDRLAKRLEELSAITAWSFVKEGMSRSVAFAGRRGFVEKNRAWESRLDPSDVDGARFQSYTERATRSGIRFSSLPEEEAKDARSLREIYELTQDCWTDVPLPIPYTRVSYEEWEAKDLRNPSLVRDGFFVALDGSRYAGYSSLWRADKEPRVLYQAMTGVRREYRGRGIAVALKLKIIDYAGRNGYETIKTWNESNNAPMLAINDKLGFKRQAGWITMEKKLG